MEFPDSFFEDEVRCGFYVPALMKRSWAAQLEVLTEVAKVCEKYHIRWFAYAGTLLGAIRHGGFIPWDDDLDICMLREDYIRFNMVAEKELPKGYHISKDRRDECRFVTPVFGGAPFDLEKEHLKRFHGFPFSPGIDIFPLDYVAPTPSDEAVQHSLITIVMHAARYINKDNWNSEESGAHVSRVEEFLNIKLTRDSSLKDQLFALLENIYSLYTADDSKEVTIPVYKYSNPSYRFPIECFERTILLPFESIKIPAPALYDEILKVEYGDYHKLIRGGGDHEYPYFHSVESKLEDLEITSFLRKYRFSPKDLDKIRIHGTSPKKFTEDFVQLIDKIHDSIYQNLYIQQIPAVRELLEACQNAAIRVGNMIEQIEGEDCILVKLLEKYCELIYQIYDGLAEDSSTVPEPIQLLIQQLDEIQCSIENSIREGRFLRKEIVFLPYKASMWEPMEPLWKKAMENPDYRVSVIPIPYYYADSNGYATNMQYEGKLFPDYVPITDYKDYDFKSHQPEKIFIQNPYDEYNLTTSVHPAFYASNLKQYTDHLIYLPCFPVDEISRDDLKSWYNMQYYVAMPGVVQADQVAVSSPQMRQIYIDYLSEFAGEDTRPIWEKKITVLDESILF